MNSVQLFYLADSKQDKPNSNFKLCIRVHIPESFNSSVNSLKKINHKETPTQCRHTFIFLKIYSHLFSTVSTFFIQAHHFYTHGNTPSVFHMKSSSVPLNRNRLRLTRCLTTQPEKNKMLKLIKHHTF